MNSQPDAAYYRTIATERVLVNTSPETWSRFLMEAAERMARLESALSGLSAASRNHLASAEALAHATPTALSGNPEARELHAYDVQCRSELRTALSAADALIFDPQAPEERVEVGGQPASIAAGTVLMTFESRGRRYNVVFDDCPHEQALSAPGSDRHTLGFFDATYANKGGFGPHGQFVSRYYASTLAEFDPTSGLDLQGDVPAWKIDANAMRPIVELAKTLVTQDDIKAEAEQAASVERIRSDFRRRR